MRGTSLKFPCLLVDSKQRGRVANNMDRVVDVKRTKVCVMQMF